jgi:hypothetical protein
MTILKWNLRYTVFDADDGVQWRAFVNKVMSHVRFKVLTVENGGSISSKR